MAQRPRKLHRAPRTVVGYHDCSRETAERILVGEPFLPSTRSYDWLGVGVYFWEYGPFRAAEWAEKRYGSAAAVLEASIYLGRCLNLLDVEHLASWRRVYEEVLREMNEQGVEMPHNTDDGRHYRDRFMIEAFSRIQVREGSLSYQTIRACYPEGEPLFPGSRILFPDSRPGGRSGQQLHVAAPARKMKRRRDGYDSVEAPMNRKNRDPNSPEAIQAVLQRIRRMTKEDWEDLVAELSRPPEGVEETWRNRDLSQSNGSVPPCDRTDADH